jgi:FixJ family two-component response regulator
MSETIVLIVSGDASVRQSLKELVESAGLSATVFPTLQALLDTGQAENPGCLVFQPENNVLDDPAQQARLRAACAGWPAILIAERGNVPTAVLGLKAGIRDVVQKPYRGKELLEHIEKLVHSSETV